MTPSELRTTAGSAFRHPQQPIQGNQTDSPLRQHIEDLHGMVKELTVTVGNLEDRVLHLTLPDTKTPEGIQPKPEEPGTGNIHLDALKNVTTQLAYLRLRIIALSSRFIG